MAKAPRSLWVMLFALIVILGGIASLILMEPAAPAQPYEHAVELKATPVVTPVAPKPAATAPATAPAGE